MILSSILLALILMVSSANAAVFLFWGQSNCAGAGVSLELPVEMQSIPPNAQVYYNLTRIYTFTDRAAFGPEVGFIHAYCADHPEEPVLVVKTAVGGTSLAGDWNIYWSLDLVPRNQGINYSLYQYAIDKANELRDAEPVTAIIWVQGEQDAAYVEAAKAYGKNLVSMVNKARQDLESPGMKFVYSLTSSSGVQCPLVRTWQTGSAAALAPAAWVETMGLPLSDNIHYNTEGQLILGKRLYGAFNQN